jgi:hypothetical protein
VTGLRAGRQVSIPSRSKIFVSSPQASTPTTEPIQLSHENIFVRPTSWLTLQCMSIVLKIKHFYSLSFLWRTSRCVIQDVPLATEPRIFGPLLRVATIRRTTDTFLFISHTTNVPLFKFRCNIFIGVRIIKEMPGSVASGTPCRIDNNNKCICFRQTQHYFIILTYWLLVSVIRPSSGHQYIKFETG